MKPRRVPAGNAMDTGQLLAFLLFTFIVLSSGATNTKARTPCPRVESIEIPDGRILGNGSLIDPRDELVYPKNHFWKENGVYRGCVCKLKPCIRKCCERYKISFNRTCIVPANITKHQADDLFNPFVFDLTTLEPNGKRDTTFTRFGVLYEAICPADRYQLEPDVYPEEDQFFLLANGSLHVPAMKTSLSINEYCLDYNAEKAAVIPLVCFPEESAAAAVVFTMYPVGMLLSTVFMAITLVVYALLPELRNLHGKLVMNHVASLLVAYLSLALVQLGTNVIPLWLCISTAFVIEFTFSAAFFWLNIMCFDICWMFSGLSSMRGTTADRDRRKLIIYSIYAWGCPMIILIISIIMQYVPSIPDTALKPRFGEDRCWFKDKMAIFAYFFGPITLLLICNLVLFIVTSVRIVKLRRGTGVLKHTDSQRSDQRENQQKFVLYLKLFLVMGLTWIMEVISWMVGGSQYLWIITDVCNTLQGLSIFLIFVWKPKVRRLLRARFSKSRPASQTPERAMSAAMNRISRPADTSYLSSKLSTQTTSLMAESVTDIAKCVTVNSND